MTSEARQTPTKQSRAVADRVISLCPVLLNLDSSDAVQYYYDASDFGISMKFGSWLVPTLLVAGSIVFDGASPTALPLHLNQVQPRSTSRSTRTKPSDEKLRAQIHRLTDAIVRRDLDVLRSQISPDRIYVEISERTGAYLTNTQTVAVIESFLRTRTAVNCSFEFVSDDGHTGSAAGTLSARKEGRSVSYKLNFGFTKNEKGIWLLTRISMR